MVADRLKRTGLFLLDDWTPVAALSDWKVDLNSDQRAASWYDLRATGTMINTTGLEISGGGPVRVSLYEDGRLMMAGAFWLDLSYSGDALTTVGSIYGRMMPYAGHFTIEPGAIGRRAASKGVGRVESGSVLDRPGMRTFSLIRHQDVTGISGTGKVAEGVVFSSGRVVMEWTTATAPRSTVHYDSIEDLEKIHGHGGSTEVYFDDTDTAADNAEPST